MPALHCVSGRTLESVNVHSVGANGSHIRSRVCCADPISYQTAIVRFVQRTAETRRPLVFQRRVVAAEGLAKRILLNYNQTSKVTQVTLREHLNCTEALEVTSVLTGQATQCFAT